MTAQPARSTTAASSISRTEWIWLGAAVACGAALRLGNLQQVAVEHFDEAVYSSNLLFPAEQGGEYPFRQLYAPPLLPAAIEWTTIVGQLLMGDVPPWWPTLPTLLAGLATIPSVWWIVRQWFSPRAGIIAALLIAFHEFHAAYCRTALTDIPLTLFVLWAVHWFWRALQTGQTRDAIIAGVFTSLAWWTKYNGWLPLAIVASGGLLWQLVTPRAERNWSRLARVWSIGAATAFVLWLPMLWDCQKVGGYAAVAANHKQYLDGFAKWGGNLERGLESITEFNGSATNFGVGGAFLMLLFAPAAWFGTSLPEKTSSGFSPALQVVRAWCGGLLAATPLYFAYPRLWHPWLMSLVLLIVGEESGSRGSTPQSGFIRWSRMIFPVCLILFGWMEWNAAQPLLESPTSWESRSSARTAAAEIRAKIADPNAPVFVHSDPAIWFQLRQQGQPALLADGLNVLEQRLPAPAFLVVGQQAERDARFAEDWKRFEPRLELVGEFALQPSRIVLLDSFSPRELAEQPALRTMTVRLYRIRS